MSDTNISTYQIIIETYIPKTKELIYMRNIPSVLNFTIQREVINDILTYKTVVLDEIGEKLEEYKKLKIIHPSERVWYNHDRFVDKQKNEIIHIDVEDMATEEYLSCVNCHIKFINNKTGELLYEFGKN